MKYIKNSFILKCLLPFIVVYIIFLIITYITNFYYPAPERPLNIPDDAVYHGGVEGYFFEIVNKYDFSVRIRVYKDYDGRLVSDGIYTGKDYLLLPYVRDSLHKYIANLVCPGREDSMIALRINILNPCPFIVILKRYKIK